MTTIVYDHKNKQIAFDSRITSGDVICSDNANKHIQNNDEHWFFCGAISDFEYMIGLEHNDKPNVVPEAEAIVVRKDNVWRVGFKGGYCFHVKLEHSRGIGSGGYFALASLDHGKSAKEAVEYAMTRDIYTGGKVHVYDIKSGTFVDD